MKKFYPSHAKATIFSSNIFALQNIMQKMNYKYKDNLSKSVCISYMESTKTC